MRLVKHVTAAETIQVPAGHLAIVVPATSLGEQKKTKGGKSFRSVETGLTNWGSVPCDNNPKLRVTLSAMAVNPEEYAVNDKKASKPTIEL